MRKETLISVVKTFRVKKYQGLVGVRGAGYPPACSVGLQGSFGQVPECYVPAGVLTIRVPRKNTGTCISQS